MKDFECILGDSEFLDGQLLWYLRPLCALAYSKPTYKTLTQIVPVAVGKAIVRIKSLLLLSATGSCGGRYRVGRRCIVVGDPSPAVA